MEGKLEFRNKLSDILKLAQEKENRITLAEVELFFEEEQLSKEQMGLVCDYLLSQNVSVVGYQNEKGVLREQREEEIALSREEETYLKTYLAEIEDMKQSDEAMASYLLMVVEEARKLHSPELFIGDVIQEGNLTLIGILQSEAQKPEADMMEEVRSTMEAMTQFQDETKRQQKKMVHQVAELDKTIHSMSEELGRKVAMDEVAVRLGVTEEEIKDILKLAGEEAPDKEEE